MIPDYYFDRNLEIDPAGSLYKQIRTLVLSFSVIAARVAETLPGHVTASQVTTQMLYNQLLYHWLRVNQLVCHEGHRGDCELYGSYTRRCVKDCCCGRLLLENNPLRVQRVICTECLHTHAILPGWLIPYRQYTVTFVLNVLLDYCERRTMGITIEEICEHYQITSNLLAQWLHEFKDDEKTWCAILGVAQRDLYSALNEIMTSRSDFLRYYFTHQPHDHERCFLQRHEMYYEYHEYTPVCRRAMRR